MTGNGNNVNLLKVAINNSWNHNKQKIQEVNLLMAGFMHMETTVCLPAAARLPLGRARRLLAPCCCWMQTVKPWFCGSLMSVLDQLATGPNLSIFSEKRVSCSLLGNETKKINKGKKKNKNSGKIEWCRLVLFVQKKRLQQSAVFCREYVASTYPSVFWQKIRMPKTDTTISQFKQALLLPSRLPLFAGFLAVYFPNEWVFLRLSILQKYFSF